jgi:hypothetical protein
VYAITHDLHAGDAASFEQAWVSAHAALPRPARSAVRPGIGFAIEHHGRGMDYFVLAWWDRENELPIRIWVRTHDAQAMWRPARESESVCVWDLQVLTFERNAFVDTLLAGTPDAEQAYLNHQLSADPT